jgi:hypothetical protein
LWYRDHDAIRDFLLRGPLQSRWRFLPTTANGQLAFGTYLWDDAVQLYLPGGLDVLTIAGGRVVEVSAFLTADPHLLWPDFCSVTGAPHDCPEFSDAM